MALLVKEVAIVVPFIRLLYFFLIYTPDSFKKLFKDLIPIIIFWIIVAILFFVIRNNVINKTKQVQFSLAIKTIYEII